jgi:glycerophosphoryl diester phosphodiesterase
MKEIKIIAHRGASAEAPENTLASITKALNLGVDFIEIDVHLSGDHIPVVMHDHTLGRTTNSAKKRHITELTLAELKKLDVGSWHHSSFSGETLPALKDVLALDFYDSGLMIELKNSPYSAEKVVDEVLKVVYEVNPSFPLIFGSFEPDLLQAIHAKDPTLSLIYIIEEESLIDAFHCKHVAVSEKILKAEVVKSLLHKHKEIWTFTVDSPVRAKELQKLGVTGIITNNPSYLQKYFI